MTIRLNGEPREVSDGSTVQQIVEWLGVNPLMAAVEVNVDIVARDRYRTMVLHEGDVMEVVHVVGGGA